MSRPSVGRPRWLLFTVVGGVVLLLVLLTPTLLTDEDPPPEGGATLSIPYRGTNYYSPISPECPYYSAWTSPCADMTQQRMSEDLEFLSANGGGTLQRIWISLDQLFDCFDDTTGFCGYDPRALASVRDTLRLMAGHEQEAVLVLFAQSNRPSDVNYFRVEALDGRHEQMRANYLTAAEEFVRYIADDPVASSAVAVVDMQNEGYFNNRRLLLRLDTPCGQDPGCIDREISKPFFTEMYERLKAAAPDFLYTVSGLRGELLGSDQAYWLSMYPVDVYDVHLYMSHPERGTAMLERARALPKPWFVGEAGTSNTDDPDQPCYTYDGDDPCTVAANTWWRKHLGPDYGAAAVLIEFAGTVFVDTAGEPAFTETGAALARLP